MQYIPNVSSREKMLKSIGLKDVDELFKSIPEQVRINKIDLPEGEWEGEVRREFDEIVKLNRISPDISCFLGGG
ncbi:MAG: hypothetical protein QW728_05365, partial [Thermoplasmata archaeon]